MLDHSFLASIICCSYLRQMGGGDEDSEIPLELNAEDDKENIGYNANSNPVVRKRRMFFELKALKGCLISKKI